MKISISSKTFLNVGVALCFSCFTTASTLSPEEECHLYDDGDACETVRNVDCTFCTDASDNTWCIPMDSLCLDTSPKPPQPPPNVGGDPHFRTWSGESYDFHGVCDLVLVKNAQFDEGLGLDIHIRSKNMREKFSYVDSVSVRIGKDTLEVKGGKESGFWLNGEQGADIDTTAPLSGKFPVVIEKVSKKSTEYSISLGGDEAIMITTWNAMVRVSFSHASSEHFGTSIGMMGAFSTGEKLGRDGITNIDDFNEFGQEWQVLETEAKLFHEIGDAIQSPTRCRVPTSSEMRRRLEEASVTVEEAKLACSRVSPAELDLCIFDVMASNDKDLAGAY